MAPRDSIDQLFDDGTHGDERAEDGIFSNTYVKTDLPGEYRITLTGYKGPIPVHQSLRVVAVPFPSIQPISPTQGIVEVRGQPVTVSMRLEGGTPPELDAGSFATQITPRTVKRPFYR